jgi:hypothetical protein
VLAKCLRAEVAVLLHTWLCLLYSQLKFAAMSIESRRNRTPPLPSNDIQTVAVGFDNTIGCGNSFSNPSLEGLMDFVLIAMHPEMATSTLLDLFEAKAISDV